MLRLPKQGLGNFLLRFGIGVRIKSRGFGDLLILSSRVTNASTMVVIVRVYTITMMMMLRLWVRI